MTHTRFTALGGLYFASLAIEAATALIRLVLAGATLGLLKLAINHPVVSVLADTLIVAVSVGPLLLSLLALAGVPGGALEHLALGARLPSARERDALADAFGRLDPYIRAPRRVYVLDAPDLDAFVIGDVLYLNRPLLSDPHLVAVLAHELAHLGLDGRLTLALRRFHGRVETHPQPACCWLRAVAGHTPRLLRPRRCARRPAHDPRRAAWVSGVVRCAARCRGGCGRA